MHKVTNNGTEIHNSLLCVIPWNLTKITKDLPTSHLALLICSQKNYFCHLFDLKSICYSGQMASSTAISDCCWNYLSLSSATVSMCSSMNATAGRVVLISWLPISSKSMSYMWRYTKEQRNNNPKSQYNKRKPAIQQSACEMKGLFHHLWLLPNHV